MKNVLSAVVITFLLSACSVSAIIHPTPMVTAIPTAPATIKSTSTPTATITSIPTSTLTPIPTEVSVPDFMREFIDLGYDKQSLESDSIYVVIDEKSVSYGPGNSKQGDYGIKYKDVVIASWVSAYYIENGILQKGNVITSYSVKSEIYTDLNPAWDWYIPLADNKSVGNRIPITIEFSRGQLTQLFKIIKGDYPIIKAELNWQRFKTRNLGNQEHFMTSLYPPFLGKLEIMDIPSIGKVIPVTDFVLDPEQLQVKP